MKNKKSTQASTKPVNKGAKKAVAAKAQPVRRNTARQVVRPKARTANPPVRRTQAQVAVPQNQQRAQQTAQQQNATAQNQQAVTQGQQAAQQQAGQAQTQQRNQAQQTAQRPVVVAAPVSRSNWFPWMVVALVALPLLAFLGNWWVNREAAPIAPVSRVTPANTPLLVPSLATNINSTASPDANQMKQLLGAVQAMGTSFSNQLAQVTQAQAQVNAIAGTNEGNVAIIHTGSSGVRRQNTQNVKVINLEDLEDEDAALIGSLRRTTTPTVQQPVALNTSTGERHRITLTKEWSGLLVLPLYHSTEYDVESTSTPYEILFDEKEVKPMPSIRERAATQVVVDFGRRQTARFRLPPGGTVDQVRFWYEIKPVQ